MTNVCVSTVRKDEITIMRTWISRKYLRLPRLQKPRRKFVPTLMISPLDWPWIFLTCSNDKQIWVSLQYRKAAKEYTAVMLFKTLSNNYCPNLLVKKREKLHNSCWGLIITYKQFWQDWLSLYLRVNSLSHLQQILKFCFLALNSPQFNRALHPW